MNYPTCAEQDKNNLIKLPDNELRSLASGDDQNAASSQTKSSRDGLTAQQEQQSGMKPGDRFIWLHLESDNRFGEQCEIVAIRGDKVDFKYVNRPNWREATMPLA